jgi:hypothetical protein
VLLTSAELIGWALGGLEREIALTRERLAALNAQAVKLRARVGGAVQRGREAAAAGAAARSPQRRRRRMTAEGRKRLSEMLKKRWADARKKNKNRL